MKHDNNSDINNCVKLNLYAVGKLALISNVLTYLLRGAESFLRS